MSILPKATDAMRARILSELDLSENRLNDDTNKLRQWLQKQPHLPQNIDDDLLRSFVIGTKGVEFGKERLDRYFSVRNAFPAIFSDRDPLKLSKPEAIQQFLLPCHTKEGYLIYMIRVRPDSTPAEFDHLSVVKRQLLFTDHFLNRGTVAAGVVGVYDLGCATAGHLTKFNLSHNMAAVRCLQDNYPLRIKKVILLNAPNFVVKMFENLIRPILKPKLSQKIIIISPDDKKTILDHLPEEAVPKDYGGNGKTCTELNDAALEVLEKERDWCIATQDIKSNEAKRIGKNKYDFNQGFGIEGTFRTLKLD